MLSHIVTVSVLSSLIIGVLGATPVVFWHAIGKTCCNPAADGGLRDNTSSALGGAYVLSLKIGRTAADEEMDSIVWNPHRQIDEACKVITADAKLKDGFNAVGMGQGGLFLRGLVQRCPAAKVKKLITLASPHQGVYGIFHCNVLDNIFGSICDAIRQRINGIAYEQVVEALIAQAGFWHNPLDEDTYHKKSSFLADINNDNATNKDYITNLQKLEKFVMVKFLKDETIVPNESTWFGFYKPGQAKETETLQESTLYTEDRLGLKKMVEDKKIDFITNPGDHLIFTWSWFQENIVERYLKA